VELQSFQSLFESSIRVMLNWELLAATSTRVHVDVLAGREALGDLHTVWYQNEDGGEGRFDDAHSRMLTVAEAAVSPEAFPLDRLLAVSAIEDSLRAQHRPEEPVLLTLPCYRADNQRLLLDATHRAVATYLSGLDVRILLLELAGPVTAAAVPDLGRIPGIQR
jgi:hypothetical protein